MSISAGVAITGTPLIILRRYLTWIPAILLPLRTHLSGEPGWTCWESRQDAARTPDGSDPGLPQPRRRSRQSPGSPGEPWLPGKVRSCRGSGRLTGCCRDRGVSPRADRSPGSGTRSTGCFPPGELCGGLPGLAMAAAWRFSRSQRFSRNPGSSACPRALARAWTWVRAGWDRRS